MATEPGGTPSLEQLDALTNAWARGRALEQLVAAVFRQHHFAVTVNARAARPRQTDVLAVKVAERFLVECKWRRRPATIDDLDGLRSRLRRTIPDVVGVLVSMSGFTEEVRRDVVAQRQQPVVLVSGDELRSVTSGLGSSLPSLLYLKRETLARDGTVLLDDEDMSRKAVRRVPYPTPVRRFRFSDSSESRGADWAGGFGQILFVAEVPDIDWTSSGGFGVSLDVPLPTQAEAGVIQTLDRLVDLGWVTGDGRWCIQQSSRVWHGFGIDSLVTELPHWRDRVEHHSEQFAYFDRCDGGFYTLSGQLDAHKSRWSRYLQLSFELKGVPLDTGSWLQLCRMLGAHEDLRMRPRDEQSRHKARYWDDPIPLTVRGLVVEDDPLVAGEIGPWVTGVVTDNPFSRNRDDLSNGIARTPPVGLEVIDETRALICSLAHIHTLATAPSEYFLDRLEWARTSEAWICAPIADWRSHDDDQVS